MGKHKVIKIYRCRYVIVLRCKLVCVFADGVFFYANYEYGLTNMSNRDNDGPTIGNRVIGITIGKFLNSKIVIDTKNNQ
ncbi:MAG: hypothetical protein EPN92_05695 [Chitinophagaceae bacterium]|nr:MAG: hypothetical protein EPN92_05695 [Chitinophagaceae bacterium]